MNECYECSIKENNLTKCKDCDEVFCNEHIYDLKAESINTIKEFGKYCLDCLNEKF